jgi:phage tail sheath protein FI
MSTSGRTTPGVYFEQVDRARAAIGPLRTDIAAFLGYAERGPLLVPVKISNWRQYTAIFGEPLNFGYLAHAIRGFFDNGGAGCHVVRVADPDAAKAATVLLADGHGEPVLQLKASHGTLYDPVTDQARVENSSPRRYDSRGTWANRLSVSLQPASRGHTETRGGQPQDGHSSFVNSLSGFEIGSIVRFSQGDFKPNEYRRVAQINPHLRQLTWDMPIHVLGLSLAMPIQLETVEFSLLLHQDSQIVERHQNLSLSPNHSRFVITAVQSEGRLVDVDVLLDFEAGGWMRPDKWPVSADRIPLSGGHDGLATVEKQDFLTGLATLALVDEVSLLAAPDLVLRSTVSIPRHRARGGSDPCKDLEPLPMGQIFGAVLERRTIRKELQDELDQLPVTCGSLDAEVEQGIPLSGVAVTVLENDAPPVRSDECGRFRLTNLPLGRVTLAFQHGGYHDLERTVQSSAIRPSEPVRFYLAPVTLPPAMSLDEIFDVQEAMLQQGERGLYRVALLDPPPEMLGLDEIQTWRARFDSAFAALYYPWLFVSDLQGGVVREIPPSGHVAGLVARTDLSQGVQRAPANLVLEGVKALTRDLKDSEQGLLNPEGINCLRVLPGLGIRVYGARTLSSDPEWRYLNVRRLVLMIEEALEDASQWVVFEPNNVILRETLTYSLNSFLNTLWRQGALAGSTPAAAYRVRCNAENNPPDVVDAGKVVADIEIAPAIPFEFIHFRLGRTIEAVEVTEQ